MIDNLNVETLKIYGFGSFFRGAKIFNDIDFLIIHETFSKFSCQAAIKCKYLIFNELKDSDISILSIKEENSLNFIKTDDVTISYINRVVYNASVTNLNIN